MREKRYTLKGKTAPGRVCPFRLQSCQRTALKNELGIKAEIMPSDSQKYSKTLLSNAHVRFLLWMLK